MKCLLNIFKKHENVMEIKRKLREKIQISKAGLISQIEIDNPLKQNQSFLNFFFFLRVDILLKKKYYFFFKFFKCCFIHKILLINYSIIF